MSQDSQDFFDFEDDFGGYDPLAEVSTISEVMPTEDSEDALPAAPAADLAPAKERIARLFIDMKARKRVLLGLLEFLREHKPASQLEEKVDELQTYDFSVFNATNYTNALQDAGAICKCDVQGEPLPADFKQQPEIVEIDGVEYYKPADSPVVYWKCTEDGLAFLDAEDPFGKTVQIIDDDKPEYLAIYRETLRYCDQGEGRSTNDVQDYLRSLDIFGDIRVYASRYLERLERNGAVLWQGNWVTTEVGRSILAHYEQAESEE